MSFGLQHAPCVFGEICGSVNGYEDVRKQSFDPRLA
jgi:hypothetical protein